MSDATTFSEIIAEYAMVMIDDERLRDQLSVNPAQFFRKMSLYLKNATARFVHPPEARYYLRYTAPSASTVTYTVTGEEGGSATIVTGATNFSIASAVYTVDDGYGALEDIPVPISDVRKATGEVTIAIGDDIPVGTVIQIDVYTDGVFDLVLDERVKHILGLFTQVEWEGRFINAFLVQTPKIKDKSFDVGSESNLSRANTERYRMLLDQANGEMLRFEQDVWYMGIAKPMMSLFGNIPMKETQPHDPTETASDEPLYIEMPRGDIRNVQVTIFNNDSHSDVEFDEIYVTFKKNSLDEPFLFQYKLSAGTVWEVDTGIYEFKIRAADTENLPAGGYVFDIELIYNGTIKQTTVGILKLTQDVTHTDDE